MAIITQTQAKEFLQITTTVSDTLIDLYVDLVSSEIEAYCDRLFSVATYTQSLRLEYSKHDLGNELALQMFTDQKKVRLNQYPIHQITAITQNNVTVTASNYTVNQDNGVVTFYGSVSDYKNELSATYVAGYTTVTGSEFTVPKNLQLVALMGVKVMYENGSAASQTSGNVKSKSLKDFSVSYGNEQTGLYVKDESGVLQKSYIYGNKFILDRYRQVQV
jgi:hypothetical protein